MLSNHVRPFIYFQTTKHQSIDLSYISTFLTELSVVPHRLHTYQGNVLKEDFLFHIRFQNSLEHLDAIS